MQKPVLTKASPFAVERYRKARFGMFIHWGLYSLLGRHEWAMCYERIPFSEYKPLAKRFNPVGLDMADWVDTAKNSGMGYMCLTTRHHEGFCLFDTTTSEFNSVKTTAGRDFVREFVDACRAGGILPCLYYSVANWSDPRFVNGPKNDPAGWQGFVDEAQEQLRELMTNYGPIAYLFYDGCPRPPELWGALEINEEIRRLQPDMLISDRSQLDADVRSAEQQLIGDPGKPWECCMTMNESWGYNPGDRNWKTPRQIVQKMLQAIHEGGNFLLNVGPGPEGAFEPEAKALLEQVGRWVGRNRSIFGALDPHPFDYADQKLSAGDGNTVYVPLHHYHGPHTTIAGIGNQVESIRLLADGRDVTFEQKGCRVFVTGLPEESADPLYTVLVLELDGKPKGVPHPLLKRE